MLKLTCPWCADKRLSHSKKSHYWNIADPMVASDTLILTWPPSIKPWRHVLTQLFVAQLAHPETVGAHWVTKQSITLIYGLM